MPAYRLIIEYEGTRFSGWQIQKNTTRTVQGLLLDAAIQSFGDAEIGGSGRTDAGVHALGQVAHLRLHSALDPAKIVRELNDRIPPEINVVDATRAPDRFHARHDAAQRVYLYQISRVRSAFLKPWIWWIRDPLDLDAMRHAAAPITGLHDFAAYADQRAEDKETRVAVDFMEIGEHEELILIRLAASHFLWKMVRKLVSALVEVGRGNDDPEMLAERLVTGERFAPTAPPSGLFLESVLYPGEIFDRPLLPAIAAARHAPQRGDDSWADRKTPSSKRSGPRSRRRRS